MRLASVEVIPYALPFREPYVTARGRSTGARWSSCGCATRTGWSGSAKRSRSACAAGPALEQVVAELEGLVRGSVLAAAVEAGTSARRRGSRRRSRSRRRRAARP